MPRYDYVPLDKVRGEIRLLLLLPGSFEDEIYIEIYQCPLSEHHAPTYEALSYTWGSHANQDTIHVDHKAGFGRRAVDEDRLVPAIAPHHEGSTLAVTQNLAIALRHLRHSDGRRVIWIDAICINQEDLDERSAEVGRMGLIYSKAAETIVWLGPAKDSSDLAIQTLRSMGKGVTYFPAAHRYEVKKGSQAEELENNADALLGMKSEWDAIRAPLRRDWFTRLWIYQEIALSKNAVVIAGFTKILWMDFRAVHSWATSEFNQIHTSSSVFDMEHYDRHIMQVLNLSGRAFSTVSVIYQTKFAQCSDPKDRVYGILSMFSEAESLQLTPDYSKSKEEVYGEFVRAHILHCGNTNMLSLCNSSYNARTLPSWIPDFAEISAASIMSPGRPSGVSRHEGHFSSKDALHVRGVAGETLSHLCEPVPFKATVAEILEICRSWQSSIKLTGSYVAGGAMIDAYVKSLVCSDVQEDQPSDVGDIPELEELKGASLNPFAGDKFSSDIVLMNDTTKYLLGRRFGVGNRGYIGIFPAAAEPGDQISIILGSDRPLLLRLVPSSDGCFHLVGHCYVAGLMEGEALLGPLPESWEFGEVIGNDRRLYLSEEEERTQEDPRLGPLPPGWEIRYYEGRERDEDGNLCERHFEHVESSEGQWEDPRFTREALLERGVDMKEFILI